jgi:hypothetical protein
VSEATRAWIYRVITALLALAALYGFVNTEQLGAWTGVLGALSGLLASLNTSTKNGT